MEVKTNMVKDPVCGMNVDEKTVALKSEYMGKTYYFCNQSCKAVLRRIRRDSLMTIQNVKGMVVVAVSARVTTDRQKRSQNFLRLSSSNGSH